KFKDSSSSQFPRQRAGIDLPLLPVALTAGKREVHRNLSIHFDRLAVQKVGLIAPLLYGINSSRGQHWMPTDDMKVLYSSVFPDNCLENHGSLNASLACQGRISGTNFVNQQTLRHALRDAYALRSHSLRYRSGAGGSADNAADHATHGAARYATRNAAHHAHRARRRRVFFLNHLNFLRN